MIVTDEPLVEYNKSVPNVAFIYTINIRGYILERCVREDFLYREDYLPLSELKIGYCFSSKAAGHNLVKDNYKRFSFITLAKLWSSKKLDINTVRCLFLNDKIIKSCHKKYLKYSTYYDTFKRKESSKYFIDFLYSFGFSKSATNRMCKVLERIGLNSIYSLRKTPMTVDQFTDIRGVGKTLCDFYEAIQNKFRDCYGK